MKSINLKKLILPNLPYLLFVYLFDKVGQAARLAPGADLSGKLLSIGDGFAAAFSSFAPSFHPIDLLVGVLGAALIRLVVYVKGKSAKKYRLGVEYGSARWGSADDIRPYIDPVFENNVLLTQTERLEYVKVPVDKLRSYFRPDTSMKQMTETLVKAMEFYNRHLERQRRDRDAR